MSHRATYGGSAAPWMSVLAAIALWLTACDDSQSMRMSAAPPLAEAAVSAKCQGQIGPDHSARSLPMGLTPRPGPAALYLPPPRAPQLENTGVWQALPILVSGASSYRCGEFVYQDWLYDDHGAEGLTDPNDPQGSTTYLFSPKVGTLTYPTDPVYANNAGDLVEFRLRPLADATAFRLTLGALKDAERMAFTIAIGNSAAAVAWPHAANVSSPAELLLTVHGTSAELIRAADGMAITPAPTVTVDMERLQVEVRVPHAAWNPQRQRVRMAVGVGLWDVTAGEYLQAGETASASAPGGASAMGAALFNAAFRAEPVTDFSAFSGRTIGDAAVLAKTQANWFRERLQSSVLASGDLSPFFAIVDFAKLADGVSDDSQVPTTGHMNRIMASRYSFGQGADNLKECGGISPVYPCDGVYIGQLQPYSIYIPAAAPPASGYGLTLLLHALSANYNQYLGSRHAQSLGDRSTGSIVITPAGRGPDGYYKDTAEADTFEVWADVARRYPLDPDWTSITGVSMGGFGTWRLSTRYPDLFARTMPIVAGGREYDDKLISLRNVPVTYWTSALDELQPVANTEPTITEMLALGLRIDSRRFETWDHLSPSTNDYYQPGVEFLGEARVERNPAHVSYVMNTSEDFARSDVVANSAYWLSGLTLKDTALEQGSIDVISGGYGLADPVVIPTVQSNDVYMGGYLEPTVFTRRLIEWQPAVALPVQDKLVIKASNIASVTIDPVRARVSCRAVMEVESDVQIAITLKGC
ncbi:MAG: hypothetical protein V4709_13720 [Pseudomonadota bacterium]